ncbi:MAG: hypothetical protein ABJA66_05225 [Actinomycetota bacterium]
MITPFEFAQIYWNLPVPIVNEKNEILRWEITRVSQYRLATRISKNPETYDGVTSQALSEFGNAVRPFANKDTKEIKVFVKKPDNTIETQTFQAAEKNKLDRIAARAIWGKGSPEEVQITLQLAVRFGLITPDRLRAYCDSGKIGLDCNGFVGTYLRDVLGKTVEPNSVITELLNQGRKINNLDEIDNLSIYVFGFVDGSNQVIAQYSGALMGHVMITNPLGVDMIGVYGKKNYRSLRVIESTGEKGLVESDYLLLTGKNGVFTVFRGSKQSEMRVRISLVWV